jgi:hypothetical protein
MIDKAASQALVKCGIAGRNGSQAVYVTIVQAKQRGDQYRIVYLYIGGA